MDPSRLLLAFGFAKAPQGEGVAFGSGVPRFDLTLRCFLNGFKKPRRVHIHFLIPFSTHTKTLRLTDVSEVELYLSLCADMGRPGHSACLH